MADSMQSAYAEARAALMSSGLSPDQMPMVDQWLQSAMDVLNRDPSLIKKIESMGSQAAGQDPEVVKQIQKLLKPEKRRRGGGRFRS